MSPMMRKWILALPALSVCLCAIAQEPYPELGAKLDEYFVALSSESTDAKNSEVDFLIASCKDSLVRQYVTLKIYDHYLHSPIMGEDAVAVYVVDRYLASGEVKMNSEVDLLNAKVFADFNRSSLLGAQAPGLTLSGVSGERVRLPQSKDADYTLLYFYDTACSSCQAETARLKSFLSEQSSPLKVYAIYVGTDEQAWERFRDGFPQAVHLWDPSMESDMQMKYGVLQTPKMFLLDPSGVIVGRSLDTPSLRPLLSRIDDAAAYEYGGEHAMDLFAKTFAVYGDTLQAHHVMDVADYMAAHTIGQGEVAAYRQAEGDLLYYLSSQRTEPYRDGAVAFIDKHIFVKDIWSRQEDTLHVLSLATMLRDLALRTPAGSEVPDLKVRGTLRRRGGFLCPGTREGRFSLRKLRAKPAYVVFYSPGCSLCQETLRAVPGVLERNARAKVLLVDMDALAKADPLTAKTLLDTFDLSVLPFAISLDKGGKILHRYVQLSDE